MPSFKNRTGEKTINNQGFEMTIIAYNGSNNIDVQFADGFIVKHKTYTNFKKGNIRHAQYPDIKYKNRTGEKTINNQGFDMTIIAYNDANNIDVQFTDGFIVKHKTYHSFRTGIIQHPQYPNAHFIDRTSERTVNNQGFAMTIITYRGSQDIDVQFSDGRIATHRSHTDFKKGAIAPPKVINNITIRKFVSTINNDWFYLCSHSNWSEPRIMSVKEIYDYKP